MSRSGQVPLLSLAAPLYDSVVCAMGFPTLWESLAERVAPGSRCLDVCTGTGGVALALARRGSHVIGLDVAAGMLAQARKKARAARVVGRTHWLRMDARRLAFPDGSFENVTCSMALHEMAEDERGAVLRELRRVASERVLVADYRVPANPWSGLLFRIARSYEYLESYDFEGFASGDFGARLERAGFGVDTPWDEGSYRVWPCRVSRR
jgi:ubiquinone/menaquinone biosynthesis C-methylase UbiE